MPLRNISLWIAGFSFLGIALLTYISLQYSSPILYNTILRGNVLLVALAEIARRRGNTNWFFLSGILMIAGYAMIFFSEGLSLDLLLPFGVLGIFNLYTIASTRFQRDEKILARYPQFFFYMSGIALIGSLFLLPYSNLAHMSAQAGLGIAVYSSIFIGLPYFIFYWLTKRYGYAHVSYWIAPLLLITFAGQAIFENYWSVVPLIPAALLLLSGGMMCSRTLAIQETLSVAPRT